MTGETWTDDACSLVDAFRRGERSPREELESTFTAIEKSDLNAFSFLDREGALRAAENADLSRPFGGVPVGVKELERVAGWPQTEASLVYRDRVASRTSTLVERLLGTGGAVAVGLTSSRVVASQSCRRSAASPSSPVWKSNCARRARH